MTYLRAFIAGLVLPSVIVPLGILSALTVHKPQLLENPFVHFIPIIWGIWNILFFAYFNRVLPGNLNTRLIITGAILGLLVAACGIFWVGIPDIIGLTNQLRYLPLILGPVLYAILWRYIVKPLNELLGLSA